MSRGTSRAKVARLLGEFLVILTGVLVALAADRWNQTRLEAATGELYLERLVEDLRTDSVVAMAFLVELPEARSVRDSLLNAVDGTGPLPSDLRGAVFTAWVAAILPPVATWAELNASASIGLISSLEARIALGEYYLFRQEAEVYLAAAERRGRDPFVDAQYRIGIVETPQRPDASARFLDWPDIRDDLLGLGGHYWVMENYLSEIVEQASLTLTILEQDR